MRSTQYACSCVVMIAETYLVHDVQAGGNLPDEEAHVDGVQRDVRVAGEVVALLHVRHQCSCHSPEDNDSRASIQVRTREKLPCQPATPLQSFPAPSHILHITCFTPGWSAAFSM